MPQATSAWIVASIGRAARVAEDARERQRRRLDDDGGPPAARRRLLERRAGQREAQRVAHRRADVLDRRGRRGRPEDDGVVGRVEVLDPRAREQRDARHAKRIA